MDENAEHTDTRSSGTTGAVARQAAPRRQSFTDFLPTVSDGNLVNELSDALADLVLSLEAHAQNVGGKPKGKLRLDLTVKLDGGVFEVVPDVVVTAPKTIRGRSIMYAAPGGGLSANNPKQYELGLAPRDPVNSATPVRALAIT